MERKFGWFAVVVALLIGLVIGFVAGTARNKTDSQEQTAVEPLAKDETELDFVTHIEADMPEQDVFVQSEVENEVVRVDVEEVQDEAILSQTVYTTAEEAEHDPFKLTENPLGPFAKGRELGFTFGEWLAADGSGTYSVEDSRAMLDLSFTGLVPDGVYTVWCSRISFPPNAAVVDMPCGAEDGSENVFTANSLGEGRFILAMDPLAQSTDETASVVAIAYHSDGETYAADPGEFGRQTHVQLFVLMPAVN